MKERIVIGAGPYHNNPGWYHTQEDELNLLNRSDWERLCSNDTLQAILAEHVWEHLTIEEGLTRHVIVIHTLRQEDTSVVRCLMVIFGMRHTNQSSKLVVPVQSTIRQRVTKSSIRTKRYGTYSKKLDFRYDFSNILMRRDCSIKRTGMAQTV